MEHKGTVTLETERLILRKFRKDDAEAVFRNWASDPEVTKYLTWPTHESIDSSVWFVSFCMEGYKESNSYQWGIERREDGALIGNISVVKIQEDIDSAEIGYVLGRAYWGKGYMPEAVKTVIGFLFEEVMANRVSAQHDVNNPNSGKVMRKAGMKYEGTLRQSDRNNQGIVDCSVYSILRSEYGK